MNTFTIDGHEFNLSVVTTVKHGIKQNFKRGLVAADYLRSLQSVFMHRPYRRMPETGWAISYLFALGNGICFRIRFPSR